MHQKGRPTSINESALFVMPAENTSAKIGNGNRAECQQSLLHPVRKFRAARANRAVEGNRFPSHVTSGRKDAFQRSFRIDAAGTGKMADGEFVGLADIEQDDVIPVAKPAQAVILCRGNVGDIRVLLPDRGFDHGKRRNSTWGTDRHGGTLRIYGRQASPKASGI